MLSICCVRENSWEYLGLKEIKPVNSKGNQSWIFIGRTDAETEAPILWPPDVEGWLIRKDPDAGKSWRQEENGTTEDEMLRWHHWLNGHESEQAVVDGEGQRSLACCSPLYHKELDTTERLNWTWPLYASNGLQLWQPRLSPNTASVTEEDLMRASQSRPRPVSSYCFLSVEKLQRINLIREVRKCRKENRQARQNNNTLAIKQSQRSLVLPQGL